MLKAMFNGGEEGKGEEHNKEVASSKFNTNIQKSIPIYDQNGYPLGSRIPI